MGYHLTTETEMALYPERFFGEQRAPFDLFGFPPQLMQDPKKFTKKFMKWMLEDMGLE